MITDEELDPQLFELGMLIMADRAESVPRVMLHIGGNEQEANATLERWRENLSLSVCLPQSWARH
jgi:hypothetical protein